MEWLLFGVGGIVGAVAAAVVAALRVRSSFSGFEAVFRSYFLRVSDPASRAVVAAFEDLEASLSLFSNAWERVKRAFRIK